MAFDIITPLVLLFTYLLCGIPFGYLVVRQQKGVDIRSVGSGNIGATNVLRAGGKAAGVLTLVLDAGKGYLAIKAVSLLCPGRPVLLAMTAVAALLGHLFPIYLKFKGGKGVATTVGVFLALAPWAALSAIGLFGLVVLLWRFVSLGSIVAAAAFPLFFYWLDYRRLPGLQWSLGAALICSSLVIWRHRENIRRLVAGTENRLTGSKP
jgi:acyl phosphate:glycerol-3-phosphate acyltransferase